MKKDLEALHKWAHEAYMNAETTFYHHYYGGYLQAVKDVLSMWDKHYPASTSKVNESE